MKNESPGKDWTRRNFLRMAGASVPTLSLINWRVDAQSSQAAESVQEYDKNKFTPLDLSPCFNCSSIDLGPHPRGQGLGGESGPRWPDPDTRGRPTFPGYSFSAWTGELRMTSDGSC